MSNGSRLATALNRRMFETSLDLMLAMDAGGRYVLVSPSSTEILGYTPEELIGRSGVDIVHADDLEHVRNQMRMARRGGQPRPFDCRCVRKDGRIVPMSLVGLWSDSDRHFFFIGRDITERIATEDRLRQAHRLEAIGQLTGGIAHDFNNLLAVVIGNLDLIADRADLSPELASHVSDALQAAERGAQLVRGLLAFARRQPLEPRLIDVNALLDGIIRLMQRTLGSHIKVSFRAAVGAWAVHADPANLESAVLNLAVNARDAMPDGGDIRIAARNRTITAEEAAGRPELRPGRWVEIVVSDTGPGMPPDVQKRAFEPFFTTKEKGKGTGLGLAMVHGFVHQSGGFIVLESPPGGGTTFFIYLPALADAAAHPSGIAAG